MGAHPCAGSYPRWWAFLLRRASRSWCREYHWLDASDELEAAAWQDGDRDVGEADRLHEPLCVGIAPLPLAPGIGGARSERGSPMGWLAVAQGGHDAPTGAQHPAHLPQRPGRVGDDLQRVEGGDDAETVVLPGQPASLCRAIPTWISEASKPLTYRTWEACSESSPAEPRPTSGRSSSGWSLNSAAMAGSRAARSWPVAERPPTQADRGASRTAPATATCACPRSVPTSEWTAKSTVLCGSDDPSTALARAAAEPTDTPESKAPASNRPAKSATHATHSRTYEEARSHAQKRHS
jgi:hypothetical protein